jgi:hypothetical protein
MIKNIVHYVGLLTLIVFMSVFKVSGGNAHNDLENNQEPAQIINPDINQAKITSIVPVAPATKQQLHMILYRQVNICQATMINLGKTFSISLATIKNIDPNLPVVAQLTTLLNITKQRYMQLIQMETGLLQKLKEGGVSDRALDEIGAMQFNEAINYGSRVIGNSHASPESVEGFIAIMLQQNVVCEGGIQNTIEKLQALEAPPGS